MGHKFGYRCAPRLAITGGGKELLATTPNDGLRDGKRALELARAACELTNWKNPNYIDTLAAAYAETGDFEQAVNWETKALEFPDFIEKNGQAARKRLEFYRKHQPYRSQ